MIKVHYRAIYHALVIHKGDIIMMLQKFRIFPYISRLLITVCIASFAIPVTANAAPQAALLGSASQQLQQDQTKQQRFERAVQKLEKYLYVTQEGTFALRVTRGKQIGIDEDIFNALYQGMEQTNTQIRDGQLRLADVKVSTPITALRTRAIVTQGAANSLSCIGRNGNDTYWWGIRFWFDTCSTGAIAAGAAPCVVLSLTYPICWALGPAAAIRTGQIITAASAGRGIWMDYNYVAGITAIQPQ